MEFSSYFHARGWSVAFAHDPEDGQAGEDERCSDDSADDQGPPFSTVPQFGIQIKRGNLALA